MRDFSSVTLSSPCYKVARLATDSRDIKDLARV